MNEVFRAPRAKSSRDKAQGEEREQDVAIVIPILNEARMLPRLARHLAVLEPWPAEILLVDGGSTDGTPDAAAKLGLAVCAAPRGRGSQINAGVERVSSPLVCVLHADTVLPDDAVDVIRATLADDRLALASFTPVIAGREKVRWLSTLHGWIKTWYAPLIFRPHLFMRGARLLFGDHAMFFRREDFLAVGGCDCEMPVMEDADLCIRLSRRGRVRMVNRIVVTSDRRMAQWGELRANWIALRIGVRWALGMRTDLGRLYPPVR